MYRADRPGCLTGLLELFLSDRVFRWSQRSFGFWARWFDRKWLRAALGDHVSASGGLIICNTILRTGEN
jgi:hypothetical protein